VTARVGDSTGSGADWLIKTLIPLAAELGAVVKRTQRTQAGRVRPPNPQVGVHSGSQRSAERACYIAEHATGPVR